MLQYMSQSDRRTLVNELFVSFRRLEKGIHITIITIIFCVFLPVFRPTSSFRDFLKRYEYHVQFLDQNQGTSQRHCSLIFRLKQPSSSLCQFVAVLRPRLNQLMWQLTLRALKYMEKLNAKYDDEDPNFVEPKSISFKVKV